MIGVFNRIPNMQCEVGTCFSTASHTEEIVAIPGDPSLRHERHAHQIVVCPEHDAQYHRDRLVGIWTTYGDQICGTPASHEFTHDWRHSFDKSSQERTQAR